MKLKKKDNSAPHAGKPRGVQNAKIFNEANQNILIIAGEESGDLLGSSIIRAWPGKNKPHFWGTGGDRLRQSGTELLYHAHDLATFGILEAAIRYRKLKKIIRQIALTANTRKPVMAILVDFPDFNMILAQELNTYRIPCYQIVSPTIWAWRYNRIGKIRKFMACVLCLYEFETEIYKKEKVNSFFMGHPLVSETKFIQDKIKKHGNPLKKELQGKKLLSGKKIISLLPGSRRSEIARHAPLMAELAQLYLTQKNLQFVIPAANSQIKEQLRAITFPENVHISDFNAPYALETSTAAVACSGTVTLECGLWGVPFLIIYRTSWLTYNIGIRLLKIPWIGMVNILLQKMAFQEYKQKEITIEIMKKELDEILNNTAYYKEMKNDLKQAALLLGKPGAAKRAAQFLQSETTKK